MHMALGVFKCHYCTYGSDFVLCGVFLAFWVVVVVWSGLREDIIPAAALRGLCIASFPRTAFSSVERHDWAPALYFSVCFSDLMGRMAVIKQQFRLHLILHAFRLSYLVKQTAFAHTLFSSAVTVISMGFPSFYGNRCRCVSVHTQLL